ncbi:MAG: hypothetical protein ACREYC_24995 [Gammaproteobacteria bacterium]
MKRAETFLKPGITLTRLQAEATRLTDNQAAQQLNEARGPLFQSINRRSKATASSSSLLRPDSYLYWN